MSIPRHFLSLLDITSDEFRSLIKQAMEIKRAQAQGCMEEYATLNNKCLIMVFEKSSTRTRVSFEIAMHQLGGYTSFLSTRDTQLGRGEKIEDSARVLSSMADAVVVRTFGHQRLMDFAACSSKPVINGLTDHVHPCQLLADMLTYFEKRSDVKGHTVAWVGDGNNVCHSYINASKLLEFRLKLACPEGFYPDADVLGNAASAEMAASPQAAVENADLVVTDVWTSMGQEKEQAQRRESFQGYQVNAQLMKLANKDALFMHCLPAHRDEEVTAEVLESKQSVVWEEAENRLHAQKALLRFLLAD